MSEEIIENITKSDSNVVPPFFIIIYYQTLPGMNFNRDCLIKNNISIPKKVINL